MKRQKLSDGVSSQSKTFQFHSGIFQCTVEIEDNGHAFCELLQSMLCWNYLIQQFQALLKR